MEKDKVAILSIGTELMTGQILNKNAQWLSSELLDMGFSVVYQMTVPDDAQSIQEALLFLENRASLILTTGGLGPTADDFTRKIIAKTFGLGLVWNEENWQKVLGKLQGKGVQVRNIHRQQSEFPEGAVILSNTAGIADGFRISTSKCEVIALPGPPKELAALWADPIQSYLKNILPESQKWVQSVWTTTGLPESEVAFRVNEVLGSEGAQVLYRAHSPCIDIKLLYQKKDAVHFETIGRKIATTLEAWLLPQDK